MPRHREERADREGEALRVVPPCMRCQDEGLSEVQVERSRWHSDESRPLKGHQRQAIRAATHMTRSAIFGA
eukprot:488953-Pyramimonas_sp.AAC.1